MMSEATYNLHAGDFTGYSELLKSNDYVYIYYDYSFNLDTLP
jgi:hypothetical protein